VCWLTWCDVDGFDEGKGVDWMLVPVERGGIGPLDSSSVDAGGKEEFDVSGDDKAPGRMLPSEEDAAERGSVVRAGVWIEVAREWEETSSEVDPWGAHQ
jgi:hypothetical protein